MILEKHPEIQRLSPAEKLALVSELWDDLASDPNNLPVSEEQIAELLRPEEAPDFEEALCEAGELNTLYERLRRQIDPKAARHSGVERYERIQRALPDDLKAELRKHDDLWTEREAIAREAGYLIGVAVGRRMVGGVR